MDVFECKTGSHKLAKLVEGGHRGELSNRQPLRAGSMLQEKLWTRQCTYLKAVLQDGQTF